MLDHASADRNAATVATTNAAEVDPEDLREGGELDLPAVWKAANADVSRRYSIGLVAHGLYTAPEATHPSAVIEVRDAVQKPCVPASHPQAPCMWRHVVLA